MIKTDKRCTGCKQIRPATDFHISGRKNGRRFLQGRCKSCSVVYMAEWRKNRTPAQRDAKLDRDRWAVIDKKYGITKAAYQKMFEAQGGACAICLQPERSLGYGKNKVRELSVDHDHDTDEVRGLLCHSCNVAIGLFDEDAAVLTRASNYLKKYAKSNVA